MKNWKTFKEQLPPLDSNMLLDLYGDLKTVEIWHSTETDNEAPEQYPNARWTMYPPEDSEQVLWEHITLSTKFLENHDYIIKMTNKELCDYDYPIVLIHKEGCFYRDFDYSYIRYELKNLISMGAQYLLFL
jgi:hypothetical protein